MSNSVGMHGEQLSVADVLYEKITGRPFVSRPSGPRTADQALNLMSTPTPEGDVPSDFDFGAVCGVEVDPFYPAE